MYTNFKEAFGKCNYEDIAIKKDKLKSKAKKNEYEFFKWDTQKVVIG